MIGTFKLKVPVADEHKRVNSQSSNQFEQSKK